MEFFLLLSFLSHYTLNVHLDGKKENDILERSEENAKSLEGSAHIRPRKGRTEPKKERDEGWEKKVREERERGKWGGEEGIHQK